VARPRRFVAPIRTLFEARRQEPLAQPFFHEWTSPDGGQWAGFYRQEQDYLIRFVDLADFRISGDAQRVFVYPVSGISDDVLEHLYLNLVVPLALSHQNKLILHASAVEIDNFSVAFAAKSGGGKSTLAASFSTNGYRFLTDDGVQLDQNGAGYHVRPNHPAIRLWEDSRNQLIAAGTRLIPLQGSSAKARFLADNKAVFCDEARLLRHIYFLGDGTTEIVSIEPVSGRDAMVDLVSHSFLLDVAAKQILTQNFKKIAQLAEKAIFYRLDYPRRYEILPEVCERVVSHARAGSS